MRGTDEQSEPKRAPSRPWRWGGVALGLAAAVGACEPSPGETSPPRESPAPVLAAAPVDLSPVGPHEGSVIARVGDRLYVADEDRSALRIVQLPLVDQAQRAIPLPGPPAHVLALADRILITVREPGLLLAFDLDGKEQGRVELADDAWGLAVADDGATAVVTSPWTHEVAVVDVASMELRARLGVRREPRAVVVVPGTDRAYVTHLTDSGLTRIDDLDGDPAASRVAFPAAPTRLVDDAHRADRERAATLSYAAVLSPDGRRLLVPRHALGGGGRAAWAGAAVIDTLLVGPDQPLARGRDAHVPHSRIDVPLDHRDGGLVGEGPMLTDPFIQPRGVALRRSTSTILVASEGTDTLVELAADSIDPAASPLHTYDLGWGPSGTSDCGAPSGVVLSDHEHTAWVFCRSTASLAEVPLDSPVASLERSPESGQEGRVIRLADDPLSGEAALGRRLFYDGRSHAMSNGMGCAGCHPDGRDDGHVWLEHGEGFRSFPHHHVATEFGRQDTTEVVFDGEPRQTPMLAGRVAPEGPYGWRGDSERLEDRILEGFRRHRWFGGFYDVKTGPEHAAALAAFLREGLRAPPEDATPLTALEAQGQALFEEATTGCASCHTPGDGEYSDRRVVELDLRGDLPGHENRERPRYRTPSLRYLAHSAPYLHDGSAKTLPELLQSNHDRMGITSLLDDEEQRALLAFLGRLGGRLPVDETAPAEGCATACAPQTAPPRADVGEAPPEEAWTDAPLVPVDRPHPRCEARRLGDWMRIQCSIFASEIVLAGGQSDGVRLAHTDSYLAHARDIVGGATFFTGPFAHVDDAVVTFPVRPGDRRQFHLAVGVGGFRWRGVSFHTGAIISEMWLDGDDGPTISIH